VSKDIKATNVINHYTNLQNAIYAELPELINRIHVEALMNCEEGSPVFFPDDTKFIEGFIQDTKRVFEISMKKSGEMIKEILNATEEEPPKHKNILGKIESVDKMSERITHQIQGLLKERF